MSLPSQWNKPPRREQCCGTCNAFVPIPGLNPKSGEPRQGGCRAVPPMPVYGSMMVGSALDPGGQKRIEGFQGMHPPVASNHWCRAWEGIEDDDTGKR